MPRTQPGTGAGGRLGREGYRPRQITPKSLDDYIEVMTKAAFQAGLSWRVIEAKWDGFREAFKGFDVKKISRMTPKDVDRLAKDTRIVRNRPKIEATIHNAETIIDLDKEYGGFRKYLRSLGSYDDVEKNLRKRFKFLGDTGIYYFLYVVKEKVPEFHEWRHRHEDKRSPRKGAKKPSRRR